jgi:hypothetical protein
MVGWEIDTMLVDFIQFMTFQYKNDRFRALITWVILLLSIDIVYNIARAI